MPVDPDRFCTVCAHWTCASCGWRRPNADRRHPQSCTNCGSPHGTLAAVAHHHASTAREHGAYAAAEAQEMADLLARMPDGAPDPAALARARRLNGLAWDVTYQNGELHRHSLKRQSPQYLRARIALEEALTALDAHLRRMVCRCNCRTAGKTPVCDACAAGEHCGAEAGDE